MAPSPCLISCATPVFFSPPWVDAGQATESPEPRVQFAGWHAATRNLVKLFVVPEPSERWATMMFLSGRVTPALSAAIAGSFHFLILVDMIWHSVSGLSLRPLTPERLYETVIGAATVGTYRNEPAATPSVSLTRLSEPA